MKDLLRIGRAQTYPASLLLVMIAFLVPGAVYPAWLLIGLFPFTWGLHFIGFGLNSFLDYKYDLTDPSKKHHPLVSGKIPLSHACKILNWGACLVAVFGVLISLLAQNPVMALSAFVLYVVFGYSYNAGLSKVSLFGFIPISLSFTALGLWGWFLSHGAATYLGQLLIAYIFLTILFQIAYSGHLKEMKVSERGNLLIKLGARVGREKFKPGRSWVWGWGVKLTNLAVGFLLLWEVVDTAKVLWFIVVGALMIYLLIRLTAPRRFIRSSELKRMSLMEILTIYLPLPLLLNYFAAIGLMIFGLVYFVGVNKILWGVSYPRV